MRYISAKKKLNFCYKCNVFLTKFCHVSEGTEPLCQRIQGQHSTGGQTDLRHAPRQVHQGAPHHQLQEVITHRT